MKMLRLLIVNLLLCGVLYPVLVTIVSQLGFRDKAQGSLVFVEEKLVGSRLLAQKFETASFFHPRPSAADFATVSSGASHAGPIQKTAYDLRKQRQAELPQAGSDAWTTSGSGLDPDVTPETAYAQVARISRARGLTEASLKDLIHKSTQGPTLGIWGQARVNVLDLNLALLKGSNGGTRSTPGVP